jgi:release factor glutamine methyltransferase
MHEQNDVDGELWHRATAAADKRAAGAPLAYAAGRANFRSLTLSVDERVLIPRPETELLVELALSRAPGGVAIDVGTGSGAIAIALAIEGRYDRVLATDISLDALEVARANAAAVGAHVQFAHGDLLGPFAAESPSLIVSNPPYVSFAEIGALPASVRDWEPMVALLSPDDGLAATARLVRRAAAVLKDGGLLAIEVDCRRASIVAELAAAARFADVNVHLDLAGRERFVLATRKER